MTTNNEMTDKELREVYELLSKEQLIEVLIKRHKKRGNTGNNYRLESTLINLKDFRNELVDYNAPENLGGWSLSNLPTHFWETLGKCINDIEQHVENYKI